MSNDFYSISFQSIILTTNGSLFSVCQRWKIMIQPVWGTYKTVDLREKRDEYNKRKFLKNIGSYIENFYCYNDHGLNILKSSGRNIKNLAVEFRQYGPQTGKSLVNIGELRSTLKSLKNLKRLWIKIRDPKYISFSFLTCLPRSLKELHIINDIDSLQLSSKKIEQFRRKLVDLSRFRKLEALTLKNFNLGWDSNLVGLENCGNLTSLRLDGCKLSEDCTKNLLLFSSLRLLSLRNVTMPADDAYTIIKNNKCLEYLCIPSTSATSMWYPALSLLPQLRVLSIVNGMNLEDHTVGFSSTLEYLEFDSAHLVDEQVLSFVEAYPNLKALKDISYAGDLISQVKEIIENRETRQVFKYYHGSIRNHDAVENLTSDGFLSSTTLLPADSDVFRCEDWSQWYTSDIDCSSAGKSTAETSPIIISVPERNVNFCKVFTAADVQSRDSKESASENLQNLKKVGFEDATSLEMLKFLPASLEEVHFLNKLSNSSGTHVMSHPQILVSKLNYFKVIVIF